MDLCWAGCTMVWSGSCLSSALPSSADTLNVTNHQEKSHWHTQKKACCRELVLSTADFGWSLGLLFKGAACGSASAAGACLRARRHLLWSCISCGVELFTMHFTQSSFFAEQLRGYYLHKHLLTPKESASVTFWIYQRFIFPLYVFFQLFQVLFKIEKALYTSCSLLYATSSL